MNILWILLGLWIRPLSIFKKECPGCSKKKFRNGFYGGICAQCAVEKSLEIATKANNALEAVLKEKEENEIASQWLIIQSNLTEKANIKIGFDIQTGWPMIQINEDEDTWMIIGRG